MHKKTKREIDLSKLPIKIYHGRKVLDWDNIDGKKFRFKYDDIIDEVEISKHNKNSEHIWINYKDIKDFKIHIQSFKNCKLGKLVGRKTSEFKIEVGTIIKDEKRDLEIVDRKYEKDKKNGQNFKMYFYHCNKCNYDGWKEESNILTHKQGCASCSGHAINPGFNDIATTDPWMVDYFQKDDKWMTTQYTRTSNEKITPICPDCGRKKDKPMYIYTIYQTHSIGCICKDGLKYPEKFMHCVLEQVFNDNFIYQLTKKHYIWIGKYKYDFYFILNGKHYIIETDGGFHDTDNTLSGQTAEESKAIDALKEKLAKKHNIEIIRIDCKESNLDYIKEKIIDKLNNLFDLSKIDWEKCHEFALSNLVKKACEYKKNNSKLTTTEIAEKMNVCPDTIRKYLKNGAKLKWCEYNVKEEQKNRGKKRNKAVEIFKNGESLEKFKSIKELVEKSYILFNIQLTDTGISRVCNGKQKNHWGFTFKFI